jgi:adenylate cyclase
LDLPIREKGILRVPVDRNVATLVPYRGEGSATGGSFRYISLTDVLHDRVPPGELTNKIVLLGTTALGLLDMRSTPVSQVFPGVEVHANLISGMLEGTIKEAPDYTLGAEVVMLLLVGLLLGLALPFLSVIRAVLLTAILAVLLVAFNLFVYTKGNLVLPIASSMLLLLAIFSINMIYGYFIESRGKRELAGLFGSYVPPALVEEMSRDPRAYNMEGRSEELTVMFSDVRGFTTISESLKPKDLAEYINEYLTSMSLIIQNYRGTLDKYIGDAIMAFWGAPVAESRHAQLAVETAMAMQAEVGRLNERFRARQWPDMQIGVGVSTGMMSVGDMGSKIRLAYTVMGDAVNLGSRLEGVTKSYGVGVIVSEGTRKVVSGIVFRELDRIRVKGKDEPIAIYEPIGKEGEVGQARLDELKLWHQTLKAYRAQQWDQTELQLFNLQKLAPGTKLYTVFAERVAALRQNPPPENWAGVTNFTEK